MSAPLQRPRIVDAAFWCWLAAAILLAALGLLLALNTANIPVFLRGAACNALKADPAAKIKIVVGCKTVTDVTK